MPDKRSAFSGNTFKLQPFQMASGFGDTETSNCSLRLRCLHTHKVK